MLLLAEIAGAQVPTSGNLFFGYSYSNTNLTGGRISLNGREGSIEGRVLTFIDLVGDFSGHYGSESSANCTAARLDCGAFNGNLSQYNFLAGPRVSASVGKVRPFAELFARCSPREHRNHEYVFRDRGRGWARLQALPYAGLALSGGLSTRICSPFHRTTCGFRPGSCCASE